jgi:thiol-disulfide isomerase/thioredoxin
MRRFPLLFLLAIVSALNVAAQSGRRITTPAANTPPPPIQPPVNPEPEIKSSARPLTELLSLPESAWERTIKAIGSDNFRLADFHGKVMVINLWASWCGPCRREVPEYESVRKAYTERGVVFVGLTTENPGSDSERVRRFVREVNFGFLLGWADRELARVLMNGRNSIPQTLVVDADGRIVSHWNGYSAGQSGNRLKVAIEQALIRD